MVNMENTGYLLFNSNTLSKNEKQPSSFIDLSKYNETFRFRHAHAFIDNKLYLCHKFGNWAKNAETFAPNYYCKAEKDKVKYTFRINLLVKDYIPYHEKKFKWTACFIGARVPSPKGNESNPLHTDSGIYLAITDIPKATIYHGKENTWPAGSCEVALPEDFSKSRTLIIEDNGERLKYSMILSTGEEKTFLSIFLNDDYLKIYNSDNTLIYSAENNLRNNSGGYFKIFNHEAQTIISSINIKRTDLFTRK